MEGYFVRTLGMHRVYNSAFMNMLRNEENANYRMAIKNTIEFDAEILKRYVNFMNNPDERTAVDQFGKGDKYFGIAVLMSTLPGLPMFGHGQVEGYAEKYGMEFRRAYWDEHPDHDLVRRHEREIFPILHRRQLFSGVENFLLYDFFTPEGSVNEDVYAFSNGLGDERALVLFHNKFASTRGWVRLSVPYTVKTGDGRRSERKTLAEGLRLHNDDSHFVIFRDSISGLEYIRSSRQVHQEGLYAELDAYKYHVFMDFREVTDDEWHSYAQLTAYTAGRGVPAIDEALRELFLAPVHQPFRQLAGSASMQRLLGAVGTDPKQTVAAPLLDEYQDKTLEFLRQLRHFSGGRFDERPIAEGIRRQLKAILELPVFDQRYPLPGSKRYDKAVQFLQKPLASDTSLWMAMLGWLFVQDTGKVADNQNPDPLSRSWIDEWQLGRVIASSAMDLGLDSDAAWKLVATVKMLTSHQSWFDQFRAEPAIRLVESWLEDSEIQGFLGLNRFKGVLWYNQENFDALLWWMMFLAVIETSGNPAKSGADVVEQVVACHDIIQQLQAADLQAEFQVEKLLEALQESSAEEEEEPKG
jgi:predicted metal-dependent HD superfamily phosphohydrolase